MNNYEQRLNDLIKDKKLQKEQLIKLLAEFNVAKPKEEIDRLFKLPKLTKQTILDLFKKTPVKPKKKFAFPKINKLVIFKVGIFFVFVIAFFMAIINVYHTLLKSNSHFHAVTASITLISFNLISFESFLFVLTSKMKKMLKTVLAPLFFTLFIFLTLFILVSIANSQFDRYQTTLIQDKVETNDNFYDVKATLEENIKENKEELANRVEKREQIEKFMRELAPDTKEYNRMYWRVHYVNKEVKKFQANIDKDRKEIKSMRSSNKITSIRKVTFFQYLNNTIFKGKIDVNFFEFIQIIVPSLIFDLISSISLGIIFFMKEEE